MSIPVKLLDRLYVILVLTLTTGAFFSIFINPNSAQLSSPVTTAAWLFIYIVSTLRLINRRDEIPHALRGSGPLIALVALCCISILWSVDPSSTRRATISLVLTSFVAIDFRIRYSLEEMVRFSAYTLTTLILIGIPFDLFLHLIPSDDFDPSSWHGLFGTKNELGRLIVLCVALFLCLPQKSKVLRFFFVCGAYTLLFKVHSTGAIVNCTVVLGTMAACIPLRWSAQARTLTLLIIPGVVGAGAYLAIQHLAQVTTSVGKDPSLTGRTVLWRLAYRSILDKPVLGYGYLAFWSKVNPLAWRIRQAANWPTAPHSHNGYIEIFLGLGLVGFLTLMVTYYKMGRKAYVYAIQNHTDVGNWPIVFLVFFIFYQVTEASLIGPNSVFWISFVIVSLHIGSASIEGPVHQASQEVPARSSSLSLHAAQ
jgi:O-antigen ligase